LSFWRPAGRSSRPASKPQPEGGKLISILASDEMMSMKSSFKIRPYQSGDESKVVLLVRELQKHELKLYDRMSPPREVGSRYVSLFLREARESGGDLIVAEFEERIVGYATLFTRQSSETAIDEVFYTYAYIGDLIVTKSARGLGIGAALLEECERLARAAGEKWLRITALAANRDTVQIYQSFGFTNQFIDMEKLLP
jgi:GNAT superfamily N-acetyltransferase